MRLPHFISLPLLAIIAGCTGGTSPYQTDGGIMPLAIGSSWIGQVKTFDARNNLISIRFDTLRISRSTRVGGEVWYTMRRMWPFLSDSLTASYANREQGLYMWDSLGIGEPTLIAKYPADQGDLFASSGSMAGGGSSNGESSVVDATDLQISVPAGVFLAYAYHFESLRRNSDMILDGIGPELYFSPGTGPIQFGYFKDDGRTPTTGPQEVWQLVRAEAR